MADLPHRSRSLAAQPLQEAYTKLLMQYQDLSKEAYALREAGARRREKFARRQNEISEAIDESKQHTAEARTVALRDPRTRELYGVHQNIHRAIDALMAGAAEGLMANEAAVRAAFEEQLLQVQQEMDILRQKKATSAERWRQKTEKLQEHVDWIQSEALRLDAVNQQLQQQNSKSHMWETSLKAERDLIAEHVTELEGKIAADAQRRSAATAPVRRRSNKLAENHTESAAGSSVFVQPGDSQALAALKRELAAEKERSESLRMAYANFLSSTVKLQEEMWASILEMKREVFARRRGEPRYIRMGQATAESMRVTDFRAEDRALILDQLFSSPDFTQLLERARSEA